MAAAIGKPFPKGKSGNPKGRPKLNLSLAEKARTHTDAALKVLVDGLKDENTGVRIKSASEILDRGWGKAPQTLDVGNKDGEAFKTADAVDDLGRDEVSVLLALAKRAKATAEGIEKEPSGIHEADLPRP